MLLTELLMMGNSEFDMRKRNIIVLSIIVILALVALFGSRPFRAFLAEEPGATSPHAIDQ